MTTPPIDAPFPDPLELQVVTLDECTLRDRTADIARVLADARIALADASDVSIRSIESILAECRGLQGGYFESGLARVEGALRSMGKRMGDGIESKIVELYRVLQDYGYYPPSRENLVAARALGTIAGFEEFAQRAEAGELPAIPEGEPVRPDGCDPRTVGMLFAAFNDPHLSGFSDATGILRVLAGEYFPGWVEYFAAAIGPLAQQRGGLFVTPAEASQIISARCAGMPPEAVALSPPKGPQAPPTPQPGPGPVGAPEGPQKPPEGRNGQPVRPAPPPGAPLITVAAADEPAESPTGPGFSLPDRGVGIGEPGPQPSLPVQVPYAGPAGQVLPPGVFPAGKEPCPEGWHYEWFPLSGWQCVRDGEGRPIDCATDRLILPQGTWDKICQNFDVYFRGQSPKGGYALAELFGWCFDEAGNITRRPGLLQVIWDLLPFPLSAAFDAVTMFPFMLLQGLAEQLPTIDGYDLQRALPLTLIGMAVGFVNRWTGGMLGPVAERIQQLLNYNAPTGFPTPEEADAAYLAGTMAWEEWKCVQWSNNRQTDFRAGLIQAERTRPNAAQVADLYLRGFIDESEYEKRSREVGVLEEEDRKRIQELAYEFPHLDDIVRMMVRDVFDQQVVEQYDLMRGFVDKFQGQARAWARARGVREDVFAKYWAAHWRYPSDTQAFEMMRRLQPDFPGIDPKLVTTPQHIDKLLEINDVAPGWRERLMATSWRILTRIDVKQAYTNGALDDAEALIHLRKFGYQPADAKVLLRVWTVARQRRDAVQLGALNAKEIVRAYQHSLIDGLEARGNLRLIGLTEEQIDNALDSASIRATWDAKRQVLKTLRKGYISGALEQADVLETGAKWEFRAPDLLARMTVWDIQRTTGERNPTLPQLCDAHTRGWLPSEEYYNRLMRIGYGPKDAEVIVKLCDDKFEAKNLAAILRARDKAAREAAAAERRRKAEEKAAAKEAAAQARAAAKAARPPGGGE